MSGNGNGDNGHGLVVTVNKWGLFLQAWLQKLLATVISAKVLITLLVIWIAHQLVVTRHTFEIVVGEEIKEINVPYLSGEQWADLMATVIVAYIGVRVAPQVITAVGSAIGNVFVAKNGNGKEESDE